LGVSSVMFNYSNEMDELLKIMNLLDIQYCISAHALALSDRDYQAGIAESIKAFHLSDGRIRSYYLYDPRTSEKCLDVMDQYPDHNIFKGIKIHPSDHQTFADDVRYRPVWEYARRNNLPIMSHTWTISPTNPKQKFAYPPLFESYVREFSDVVFIMGHSGGRYQGIAEAARLGQMYANVYYDIAGDIHINYLLEYLCAAVGSNRILYGSDYAMMDQRTMLGAVFGAAISARDKENILYNNANALFRFDSGDETHG